MKTLQFIEVDPNEFITEIVGKIKNELFADIKKLFNENQPKEYLSADEVCNRLSITKPTIHEWRKRGILKSYKLGSRVYYRFDEIESAMITD